LENSKRGRTVVPRQKRGLAAALLERVHALEQPNGGSVLLLGSWR
jgi:hypothetical protein